MTFAMPVELSSLLLMCLAFMDICLQILESTNMLSMSLHYITLYYIFKWLSMFLESAQGEENIIRENFKKIDHNL